MYLEDLFIRPERRGKGIGRKVLQRLSEIGVENNCARIVWQVSVREKEREHNAEKLACHADVSLLFCLLLLHVLLCPSFFIFFFFLGS